MECGENCSISPPDGSRQVYCINFRGIEGYGDCELTDNVNCSYKCKPRAF